MTLQDEYITNGRRALDAVTDAAGAWTENIQKVTEKVRTPVVPVIPIDATAFVEQWFDFTERVARVNREYVVTITGALNTLGGAVRQHVDGLGAAVRDQVQAVSGTAKEQLDKAAKAEREQLDRAEQAEQAERDRVEQAEREKAREARNAERQKARQARQAAHERYEGLTKAELVEELGRRELPKTGTVDELVERLVSADTQ